MRSARLGDRAAVNSGPRSCGMLAGRPCITGGAAAGGSHRAAASARAVACHATAARPQVNKLLLGTWVKDTTRSTSMDPVSDLVQLAGPVRAGVQLIKGCRLSITPSQELCMSVFSAVPFFSIDERYPLSGSEAGNMRRDLRFGTARGRMELGEGGLVRLHLAWGAPFAGGGVDEFVIVGDNELHVMSSVTVGGRTCSYTSIHRRER